MIINAMFNLEELNLLTEALNVHKDKLGRQAVFANATLADFSLIREAKCRALLAKLQKMKGEKVN